LTIKRGISQAIEHIEALSKMLKLKQHKGAEYDLETELVIRSRLRPPGRGV